MKNNWQTKKLGDICEVVGGGTPSTSIKKYWDNNYYWVTPKDLGRLGGFEISKTERKISKLGLKDSSAKLLPPGSVILSSRAPIGYVFINTVEMATNQGCRSFICGERIINKYLYYFLVFNKEYLNKLGTGATFKEVSGSALKEIEIPLPPLSEQKRIAKTLDEAFEKLEKTKENTEKNLQNSKELFESYLNDIFSKPEKDWKEKRLDEVYEIGSSKRVLKSQWKKNGVPFYRGREITKLAINGYVENELFISESHYNELIKISGVPKPEDIVITAIGTIGNSYVVREGDRFYFKDASVLWMKKNTSVNSDFIKFWIKSALFFGQLEKGGGATVDTLTIKKLQSLKISVPSITEQKQIVKKLDKLSEKTQKLESLYKQKLESIDELKKSILSRVFSRGL